MPDTPEPIVPDTDVPQTVESMAAAFNRMAAAAKEPTPPAALLAEVTASLSHVAGLYPSGVYWPNVCQRLCRHVMDLAAVVAEQQRRLDRLEGKS